MGIFRPTGAEAANQLVAYMLVEVAKFNKDVTALPIPERPTILKGKRLEWALKALAEEMVEFEEACEARDVVEAADALIDLVYFALGRIIEMGIPPAHVFYAVQQANLSKQRGTLAKRPGSLGHDAVKPAGWQAPDHSWLLTFTSDDMVKAAKWDAMSPVLKRVVEVRAAKGQDYNRGPELRDYFPFGHQSYAQMMHVKMLRIHSLLATGNNPKHESLGDTLDDIINYATFYREAIDGNMIPTDTGRWALKESAPNPEGGSNFTFVHHGVVGEEGPEPAWKNRAETPEQIALRKGRQS